MLILVLQIYEMHYSISIPKFYNQTLTKDAIKVLLIEMYTKTLHSKMKAENMFKGFLDENSISNLT